MRTSSCCPATSPPGGRSGLEHGRVLAELAGQLLRLRLVTVDDLDLVSTRHGAGADPAAHVPRTNDRHPCHGATSSWIHPVALILSCRP
jgi:hypothetical protein